MAGNDNTLSFIVSADTSQFVSALKVSQEAFNRLPETAKANARATDDAFRTLGMRTFDTMKQEMKQVSLAFNDIATSGKLSASELSRVNQQYAATMAGLQREINGASSAASSGLGAFESLKNSLMGIAAAYVSWQALKTAIMGVIETSGKFESIRASLDSIEGGAEKGAEAFAYIKRKAMELPYTIDQVAESYRSLRASGLDPTAGSLQTVADVAAKLGGGQERLTSVTRALTQMWAKQKINSEEMSRQLSEQGIPVWDMLARAMGKTVAETMKMSEAGQLGKDAVKLLFAELAKWGSGASEAQMKTWNGLVSNMKDVWMQFADAVGRMGFMDELKENLTRTLAVLAQMQKDGRLDEWAAQISSALTELYRVSKNFLSLLLDLAPAIALAGGALATIKLAGLITSLASIIPAAGAAGAAISGIGTALTLTTGIVGVVIAAFMAFELLMNRWNSDLEISGKRTISTADAVRALRDAMNQLQKEDMGGGELYKGMEELQKKIIETKRLADAGIFNPEQGALMLSHLDKQGAAFKKQIKDIAQLRKDYGEAQTEAAKWAEALKELGVVSATAIKPVQYKDLQGYSADQLMEQIANAKKEVETQRNAITQINAARDALVDGDRKRGQERLAIEEKIAIAGAKSTRDVDAIRQASAAKETESLAKIAEAVNKSVGQIVAAEQKAGAAKSQLTAKDLIEKTNAAGKTVAVVKTALEKSISEYAAYVNKVKSLEDSRKSFITQIDDMIEAKQQSRMTESQRNADNEIRSQKKLAEAQKAAADGNYDAATKAVDKAAQYADKMTDSVKSEEALAEIKTQGLAIADKAKAAAEEQASAAKAKLEEQKALYDSVAESAAKLSKFAEIKMTVDLSDANAKLEVLKENLSKLEYTAKLKVEVESDKALAQVDAIKIKLDEIQDKTVTVTVETVEAKAGGGLVGAAVPGYAGGGNVTGSGGTDTIPAMLTAGEYVQPVSVVDYYGSGLMEKLRRMAIPRDTLRALAGLGPAQYPLIPVMKAIPPVHLAEGGMVGGSSVGAGSSSSSSSADTVRIEINMGSKKTSVFAARDQARAFTAMLNEISRGAIA